MKSIPRVVHSTEEAKIQAAEYFGFASSTSVRVDNGKVFEIPNPGLLDDDQQERYEELQFFLEQCDREPDTEVPEQSVVIDDKVTTIAAYTIPGEVKKPFRINGELLKPPYAVRLAIALFGEEGYAEYKANGGIANLIGFEWARMNKEYQERVAADSKSEGDGAAVEGVPAGD
ncbi:hypothetical protein [Mycobacterium phage WXIN]|nr:hypothetical protein [Mycobacterium phage WXIN]